MTRGEMEEEIGALLEKAARNFDIAGLVLEADSPDIATSRAYYGCFYVAEALLLSEGLRFSSHGQVVGQYGLRFAKTDLLDRRFHRLLGRAFGLRQTADYDARPDMDSGEVRRLIEGGMEFLGAARDHLRHRLKDHEEDPEDRVELERDEERDEPHPF